MNDLKTTANASPALLDELAAKARYYQDTIWRSGIELGWVLTEAKKLVPHGEWRHWLEVNAEISLRGAQQMMQLYSKFGGRPAFKNIEKSKLLTMLSLPEGSEEEFIAENDVSHMTVNEVKQAVSEVKRQDAGIPEEIADKLLKQQEEIARLTQQANDAVSASNVLRSTNRQLQIQIDDGNILLQDMQTQYDLVQSELTRLRSDDARGDAERTPRDELTAEVFSSAVRQFMGICSTMPQMGKRFAAMDNTQRLDFEEGLMTIEGWAKGARGALDMICGEVLTV